MRRWLAPIEGLAGCMPIRINLFHELEAAAGPVRRGFPAGWLWALSACVAAAGIGVAGHFRGLAAERAAEAARLEEAVETARREAGERERRETALRERLRRLGEIRLPAAGDRVLWGSLLERFFEAGKRDVWLTEAAGRVEPDGAVVLEFRGVAAGIEPGAAAESLRAAFERGYGADFPGAVARVAEFREEAELVELEGRAVRSGRFVMECRLPARGSGSVLGAAGEGGGR